MFSLAKQQQLNLQQQQQHNLQQQQQNICPYCLAMVSLRKTDSRVNETSYEQKPTRRPGLLSELYFVLGGTIRLSLTRVELYFSRRWQRLRGPRCQIIAEVR